MVTLILFGDDKDDIEKLTAVTALAKIPYPAHSELRFFDYLGNRKFGYANRQLLDAYDDFCRFVKTPLYILSGYKQSGSFAHRAGLALDIASRYIKTDELRKLAVKFGSFSYVEPPHLSPTWLHVELFPDYLKDPNTPHPVFEIGSYGASVIVLNELLKDEFTVKPSALPYEFSPKSEEALRGFQRKAKLRETGKVDAQTWNMLLSKNRN